MSLKESLTNFVAKSQTLEDIIPFLSLLPLQNIKSAVTERINELENKDVIRKLYYNNVNIENFLAQDLLSHVISYLPMNQICTMSRTSTTIHKATIIASKHENLFLSVFEKPDNNDSDDDALAIHFKQKEIMYSKSFFRLVQMSNSFRY